MGVLVYHRFMVIREKHLTSMKCNPVIYTALVIGVAVCSNSNLMAESDQTPVVVESPTVAIDSAHKGASKLLNGFASQIDNYFADEIDTDKANDTSATLRVDFADPSHGDISANAKLKLRLVLPRSQRRVRLLLDVDDEDIDDNSRSSSAQSLSSTDEDRSLALALRFIRKVREGASVNIDIGARRHEQKFQTFARLRTSAETTSENGWSSKINNDLREYYSTGYWNRLNFDFWRYTREGSSTVFRTSTSFKWQRNHAGARVDQTIGVYKELSRESLLAFEALAGYNTSPANESESYYEGHQLRLRYRRNAFRPWFHFEVWPSISWLSGEDSDPKIGGLIRTEVRFGKY